MATLLRKRKRDGTYNKKPMSEIFETCKNAFKWEPIKAQVINTLAIEIQDYCQKQNITLKNGEICSGMLPEYIIDDIMKLYIWFLACKVYKEDYNATILSPPFIVDKVWHVHISNTKNYIMGCICHFHFLIHHDPLGGVHDKEKNQRIQAFSNELEFHCAFESVIDKMQYMFLWTLESLVYLAVDYSNEIIDVVKEDKQENDVKEKQENNVKEKQIFVRNIDGKTMTIMVPLPATIAHVKKLVFEKIGMDICSQRLIFNGRQTRDDNDIGTMTTKQNTFHLLARMVGC